MNALRPGLLAAALVAVTLLCYLPALSGDFVFDDNGLVRDNPLLQNSDGLLRIWFSTEPVDYWPLSYTSFWLQYRFFGEQSTGYHLVNLALHCLTSLLIWRLLLRLRIGGAWLAALLFAIHPVNVETGAWVFQQKSTLAAVFYVSSLLCFLRHRESAGRRWLVASLCCFALAMLAKTSVVMLPAVLLGVCWWQRGRVVRDDLALAAPFLLVALLLGGLAIWFQFERAIGEEIVRTDGFLARLAGAGCAVWFYLGKALVPIDLCFIYPRWQIDPTDWGWYVPGVALAIALATCWRYRRTWGRPCLAALGYYILALGPVLGFVNISYMRYSLVADHWQYLAILAPIALIVGSLSALWQKLADASRYARSASSSPADNPVGSGFRQHWRLLSRAPSVRTGLRCTMAMASIAVVAACCWLSWRHAHRYANEIVLYSATLETNPAAWLAHNNLGKLYTERGEVVRGELEFKAALRLAPAEAIIIANLARNLMAQNKRDECMALLEPALQEHPQSPQLLLAMGNLHAAAQRDHLACNCYRAALRLAPNLIRTHEHLATCLIRLGELRAARLHCEVALAGKPDSVSALIGLGKIARLERNPSLALKFFQQALVVSPDALEAHLNLVVVLEELQRTPEAIAHLQQAVRRKPGAQLHAALGERLAMQGQPMPAMTHFNAALKLDTSLPETHAAMADLLGKSGQFLEATEHYRQALRLKPELHEAREALAKSLASLGQTDAAIEEFRVALTAKPDSPGIATNLAWLLATRSNATVSELHEAIHLAEQACRQTKHQHPVALDTLAAACDAAGQLDRAILAAQQAKQQAMAIGQIGFAQQVQRRLDDYQRLAARAGVDIK